MENNDIIKIHPERYNNIPGYVLIKEEEWAQILNILSNNNPIKFGKPIIK